MVVYEPEQTIDPPATRIPPGSAGQDTDAILLSETVIGDTIVMVPALVTVKVYGTTVPTALKFAVVVALTIDNAGVPMAIDVTAVLLALTPSFVAPVVPLTVDVPLAVGVPVTEQVMALPCATTVGGVGEHTVARPAGKPATEHVAAVAVTAVGATLVHVNVPL